MSEDDDEQLEERTGLVFVDPDARSRTAAESLEEAIGRRILAVDPSELDLAAESEEIQQAAVFVLCWDQGFRCAADLVEALRASDDYRDRAILVATSEPTRRLVVLAMALGADGLCRMPWDGDELAAALDRLGIPKPAEAAA
ncbi:MAG: hypothetical protein R3F35_00530 [Myxococcota bacterium]